MYERLRLIYMVRGQEFSLAMSLKNYTGFLHSSGYWHLLIAWLADLGKPVECDTRRLK